MPITIQVTRGNGLKIEVGTVVLGRLKCSVAVAMWDADAVISEICSRQIRMAVSIEVCHNHHGGTVSHYKIRRRLELSIPFSQQNADRVSGPVRYCQVGRTVPVE